MVKGKEYYYDGVLCEWDIIGNRVIDTYHEVIDESVIIINPPHLNRMNEVLEVFKGLNILAPVGPASRTANIRRAKALLGGDQG